MNKYFDDLQISYILSQVEKHLISEQGRQLLADISYYTKFDEFEKEKRLFSETIGVCFRFGKFSLYNSKDLKKQLILASKGGLLDFDDFKYLSNDIRSIKAINEYNKKYCAEYPSLRELIEITYIESEIEEMLNRVFDEEYNVKDEASGKLKSTRRAIKLLNQKLSNTILEQVHKYETCLSDVTYSIRDNSYVLPVKSSLKNRVNGLVLDISDSGETTFIEPQECLIIQGEIYKLRNEEKEEIVRILRELSEFIGEKKDELLINNEIIGKLDFLSAKYMYAREINGISIDTINDKHINIITGKHPLIDPKLVVPNTVNIDNNVNQLIISGPNAGGKSVLLKLIGLCVLMNQMILPFTAAEESSLGFFSHLFLDIGDSQSIQDNLSTFSGHMYKVINILNKATERDLVLIDELGTGTDPKEGEALAVSICSYLNEKNVKSVVTSHFNGVKKYSLATEKVLCGSMSFDENSLTPRYKLYIGIPGNSYGLDIAKKYGMNKQIIAKSIEYINSEGNNKEQEYLSILMDTINKNTKIQSDNLKLKDELQCKIKAYNEKDNLISKKIATFNSDMKVEKENIITDTLETLNEIKRDLLAKDNLKLHEIIQKEKELESKLYDDIDDNDDEFTIGDYVENTEFGVEGEIISIGKNGYKIKTNGGKIYTFSKEYLKIKEKIISREKKKKINKVDSFIMTSPLKYELNIIGYHLDEAKQMVENFVDNAVLSNAKTIRVVHGFGSGALRNMVHALCKNNKYIKDFTPGGQFDGGYGVTIINLK